MVVVDSNGRVIADSEHSTHGQVHSESDDLIAAIAAREPTILEDVACEYCAASGAPDRHVLAFAPLRMAPWGVGIERCTRRFPGEGMRLGYSLAVMLAVLVLTGIVLSRALSRSVVRPLSELSEQAEKIRAGDLGVALEVEGDEEIRSLATTLDDARQRLAATLEELGALNEELESKVRERTRESRRLVRRLLRAGEEERRRIARELHDEISQLLTVVQISIEGIDAPEAHVEKARSVLAKAQKEIHRIIFDLRPSLLDDLGLAAAIRWYAKNYLVSSDVQVDLEIQEGLRLSPEIEITVFRIYQEIVTNILRHSGADYASVELYAARDRLVLTVEDNGVGFDPQSKTRGAGLVGLRERASLAGGTLRVDSEPGEGTSVRLEVPFGS